MIIYYIALAILVISGIVIVAARNRVIRVIAWFVFGILLLLGISIICSCRQSAVFPTEGIWYCDELQLQLDFGDRTETLVETEGAKVKCQWVSDRGSPYIAVVCDVKNCEHCPYGECIFKAEYSSSSETELILESTQDGKFYTFYRGNT